MQLVENCAPYKSATKVRIDRDRAEISNPSQDKSPSKQANDELHVECDKIILLYKCTSRLADELKVALQTIWEELPQEHTIRVG